MKKSLLLMISLIAIASCGGGGGGGSTSASTPVGTASAPISGGTGGGGSGNGAGDSTNIMPSNSIPSLSTPSLAPRLIPTDSTQLQIQADTPDYRVTGETTYSGMSQPIHRTYYEVNRNEIGFHLGSSGELTILFGTTVDVKSGGVGVSLLQSNISGDFLNNIRNTMGTRIVNSERLTFNMEPGSTLLLFTSGSIDLSEIAENYGKDIVAEIPESSRPTVNGTGYKMFKFNGTKILIDRNVNLDDPNDIYNKVLSENENLSFDLVSDGLTMSGTKNNQIGLQSKEAFENLGKINLSGNNSVGVYVKDAIFTNYPIGKISVGKNSTGIYINSQIDRHLYGRVENKGTITLGEGSTGIYLNGRFKDTFIRTYSGGIIESNSNNVIGMAAKIGNEIGDRSFLPEIGRALENKGTIDLKGDKSIGMFATGDGSYEITNNGDIIIGDSFDKNNPSIGMYSNNPNAELINENIEVRGISSETVIKVGKNSIGMAGIGSAVINDLDAEIQILSDGGVGMYLGNGATGVNNGLITTVGSPRNAIGVVVGNGSTFENNGTIRINSEGGAAIVVNGGTIRNYGNIEVSGGAVRERIDPTRVQLQVMSDRTARAVSDLGVYVDTQGRTRPIEGLSNLRLNSADLLIGPEATEKTNATEVTVDNSVLEPFNNSIRTSGIQNWNVKTGSLVWEAESEISNNRVEKVTLKKQSYTKFADSEISEGVAKGLDEKYTETSADSKDKQTFNYLNTLSDRKALAKTYREINGSQYVNVQQRVAQTSDILDGKLSDLQKENADKSGHHVSTFFNKDKYESRSEEIADTNSSAYGVAYMFNNADAKQGVYAGTAINTYKFKDNGKSKENVTMFKLGAYKTFDLNNIEWTLSGDGFVSQNDIKRRFIIGNDIYENRADYNAYGFAVRNELGKTFRIGKNVTIKPYAALKLGYGRFSKIREKDGTMAIEVSGNDYYSIKPMAGLEFGFAVPVSSSARFTAILGLGYEHELGKVENNVNEARFINGTNSWKLRSKKEEVRGNLKTDIKAGFEAGNFGVYLTGGHNTKGKNSHVGVNLGVSF